MPLSRRALLSTFGLGGAGAGLSPALVAARGREALVAEDAEAASAGALSAPGPDEIRIDSNENPLGPGRTAMEALLRAFEDAGRYPTNSRPSTSDLKDTVAHELQVKTDNVVLGAGSRELLRNAVRVFTSPDRPLVTAAPSYEQPERMAEQLGVPVRRVPVDAAGRLDLDKMAEAAKGAGLVFFCNPNNPTSTVHPARAVAEFVTRVRRLSPETAVLVDEAYHDYVTDPGYATALPLALDNPSVFISRTLSKAYGMAGMRIGYAVSQAPAIAALARWAMPYNQNALGLAAAIAALRDPAHIAAECARNEEVRQFTTRAFESCGCKVMESQANFVFVDIGRPAKEFREACQKQRVFVGREFPPLDKTHARISLGTMEEMRRAVEVCLSGIGINPTTAAARR